MGCAEQVVGRAGTKGDLTITNKCKKCGMMPQNDFLWFLMRKREPVRAHTSRTRCCCVYFGAPGQHVTGICTVTMQFGDEEDSWCTRLNVHRRETMGR